MKLLRVFSIFLVCLILLTACTPAAFKEIEKTVFTYGCRIRDLEDLKDDPSMHSWASDKAEEILDGEYTPFQVKAFISNMDSAGLYSVDVKESAIKFLGIDQYPQRLETDGVIAVLEELEENAYYDDSQRNFYRIYWYCVSAEQVHTAAKAQLTPCSIENGYYDDAANHHEQSETASSSIRTAYTYEYMGDFCQETLHKYNAYGEETAKEPGVVYYRGNKVSIKWDDLKFASEIYSDGVDKLVWVSLTGGVHGSFITFDLYL